MPHRDLHLTQSAQEQLEGLPSTAYEHVMDYLDNPLLRRAADEQKPLRLWASTNALGSWMELTCDESAHVDIQFWQRNNKGECVHMDPCNVKMEVPLPKKARPSHNLVFDRSYATIGKMAYAALDAARYPQEGLFERMLQVIADYVPRVAAAWETAKRLHGPEKAITEMSIALRQTSFFGDYVGLDRVHVTAMPCSTMQLLLNVHASVHTEHLQGEQSTANPRDPSPHALDSNQAPGLYALETPQKPTTYLFIGPKPPADPNVASAFSFKAKPGGLLLWMDADATPLGAFITGTESDTWWANNPQHPSLQWAGIPGRYDVGTDTFERHGKMYFNDATRALCDELAAATPRRLGPEETLAVVENSVKSAATLQSLWPDDNNRKSISDMVFNPQRILVASLQRWMDWSQDIWGHAHPKERSVLVSLLPPPETLDGMQTWREHMNAMNIMNAPLLDASTSATYASALTDALHAPENPA